MQMSGWKCKVQGDMLVCSMPISSNKKKTSGPASGLEPFLSFVKTNGSGVCCVYSNSCHHCHDLISACHNWSEIESQNGQNGILLICYDTQQGRQQCQQLGIQVNGVPTTVEVTRKGSVKALNRNAFIKMMNDA